jgi:hypothetical protein
MKCTRHQIISERTRKMNGKSAIRKVPKIYTRRTLDEESSATYRTTGAGGNSISRPKDHKKKTLQKTYQTGAGYSRNGALTQQR